MLTEVYICLSHDPDDENYNGLNMKIQRCDYEDDVDIQIVDDGEKPILTFGIDLKILKKAIEKLEI